MAYHELIKNFSRIRDYMKEFYVYGFKSRGGYTQKSARSYDDEKRRVESWLGDYMSFKRTPEGKNVFLSIDSRAVPRNPLFAAWKSKSFTDGDITLHFLLMDILADPERPLTLAGITERIDELLSNLPDPRLYDESTVRKKLKEYAEEGIVRTEKKGKAVLYSRVPDTPLSDCVLSFKISSVTSFGSGIGHPLWKFTPARIRRNCVSAKCASSARALIGTAPAYSDRSVTPVTSTVSNAVSMTKCVGAAP